MADLPWSYQLRPGERANPVVAWTLLDPAGWPWPTDDDLLKVFKTPAFKLQTWGRTVKDGKTVRSLDPHWIAVRGSTPLHNDRAYPRFSHHLKIRVDDGISCRGMDRTELPLQRGLFYVLDTHSPHQIVCVNRTGPRWNVACSIDADEPLPTQEAIEMCLAYALTKPILPEYDPVTGFNVRG